MPVVAVSYDSVTANYSKEHTDYAYALVEGQLKKSEDVEIEWWRVLQGYKHIGTQCECAFSEYAIYR